MDAGCGWSCAGCAFVCQCRSVQVQFSLLAPGDRRLQDLQLPTWSRRRELGLSRCLPTVLPLAFGSSLPAGPDLCIARPGTALRRSVQSASAGQSPDPSRLRSQWLCPPRSPGSCHPRGFDGSGGFELVPIKRWNNPDSSNRCLRTPEQAFPLLASCSCPELGMSGCCGDHGARRRTTTERDDAAP